MRLKTLTKIPLPFCLPAVTMKSREVSLKSNGIIYANKLILKWNLHTKEVDLVTRERKQLNIETFLKTKELVNVLLEITDGLIVCFTNNKERKTLLSDGFTEAIFLSIQQSYLFFSELVEFIEKSRIEGYNEEKYDQLATKLFSEYSENGFGLDPYDTSYMIYTSSGVFLLNEYIFEDVIDKLLPGSTIGIKIKETRLLSIGKHTLSDPFLGLTEEQKIAKALYKAQQERSKKAYIEMHERIKKRRERGEGPSFV